MLIVQGDLDTQVPPVNADRLEALARKRKNAPPLEVAKVPGVNHLLVPATTGEIEEYAALKDSHISPAVTSALTAWLRRLSWRSDVRGRIPHACGFCRALRRTTAR